MQKNPCYGDHTLPVYEEVQLQNKAAELSDDRVKANERISINFAKRVALVVVLFLSAIAMVVAITLSTYALVSSNQGMDSVIVEIQQLQMQLNKTREATAKLQRVLTRLKTDGLGLQKSVDMAKNGTMTQLNSLQSSVSSLTTRVNSRVNLYQNCSQDTRSCTSTSGSAYWKLCTTPSLPANKPVSCQLCCMY